MTSFKHLFNRYSEVSGQVISLDKCNLLLVQLPLADWLLFPVLLDFQLVSCLLYT